MENNLKVFIINSGLKQSYIASKLGISENTLSCYISGRRNPKVYTAKKLADILNCSVEDIFLQKININLPNK
ncbi:MAG: helix-turn-helix transcriptional regulator [Candidatus Humimicrobiaceae bacterium]